MHCGSRLGAGGFAERELLDDARGDLAGRQAGALAQRGHALGQRPVRLRAGLERRQTTRLWRATSGFISTAGSATCSVTGR